MNESTQCGNNRAVTFDPNDKYGDNAAIAAESMRRIMLKLNQVW